MRCTDSGGNGHAQLQQAPASSSIERDATSCEKSMVTLRMPGAVWRGSPSGYSMYPSRRG